MGKGAKGLRPDDTEISSGPIIDLSKAAVENVCKDCHAQRRDDSFATLVVMVGYPAESERDRDLNEEPDRRQSIRVELAEAKLFDERWCIGIEATLRSVVAQSDDQVAPHPPVAECFLECRGADALFLLAFGWIIELHALVENIDLALGEHVPLGKECAVWVLEGVWQAEAKYSAGKNRKGAHENEKPEPAGLATDAVHVQDAWNSRSVFDGK